jgi:hypothetical protein
MPRTFTDQGHYDLLLDFISWLRDTAHENAGYFEYDTNDEIVEKFLVETDDE